MIAFYKRILAELPPRRRPPVRPQPRPMTRPDRLVFHRQPAWISALRQLAAGAAHVRRMLFGG